MALNLALHRRIAVFGSFLTIPFLTFPPCPADAASPPSFGDQTRQSASVQLAAAESSRPPEAGSAPAYDDAFKAMQTDPGNAANILKFAQIAIGVGDLEGAIASLERLLVFNPDLPSVRVQLGILYYRLGSFAISQTYLERGLRAPDLPPDLASKGREYLALVERAQADNRLSGSLTLGFRGQTNANAAPANGLSRISLGGIPFDLPLSSTFLNQSDENLYGTVSVSHVYDPHWDSGATWESNANLYGAEQFHLKSLSLVYAQVDTGPRFPLGDVAQGLTVRPYALGEGILLGASPYYFGYGGGLSAGLPVTEKASLSGSIEARNLSYHPTGTRPRVDDRSGPTITATLAPTYILSENQALQMPIQAFRADTRGAYESYWRYAITPTYLIQFDPDLTDAPWRASLSLTRSWASYDSPDAVIDASTTRNDREWDVGGSIVIGLSSQLSILVQAQQAWARSTIPNYAYNNFTGQTALIIGF